MILYRNQDFIRRHQDLVEVLDILEQENDRIEEQQERVCDGREAAQHDPEEQGKDSTTIALMEKRHKKDRIKLQKAEVAASAKAIGSFSFLYISYRRECW